MKNIAVVLGWIAFFVVVIAGGPLAGIWALNTLFGLGIPYTLQTWAASFVLATIVGGPVSSRGEK